MKKNESSLYFSEVEENEKDNLKASSQGITRRLLEKYKPKNNFKVINGARKGKEVNIAA
tara:strand:- start:712 stop:888 length:177 start_codon:yes stop_codon:yes gene_type:complete